MPFTIPNESDAAFPSQAAPDSTDIAAITAASERTGVVSGCAVTAQGTPDMTVAVAAGTVSVAGATASVAAGNVTIGAADGTNDRKDIVVVSNAGAKSVVTGTAAADPVKPAIPANSVLLAEVYVPASDTDIDANQITDRRMVLGAVAPAPFVGARVYRSSGQTIPDSTTTVISFANETEDSDGFHDNATNPSRLTVPSGKAGVYLVTGTLAWAVNSTGERIVRITKNGTAVQEVLWRGDSGTNGQYMQITALVDLGVGDYVELDGSQNSGGDLTAHGGGSGSHTSLQMFLIGA